MSRSYKKIPCIKDHPKDAKKLANKNFRRKTKNLNENISNGMFYKKYYDSYDICDWKVCCYFNDYKLRQERTNKKIINKQHWFYARQKVVDVNAKSFYKEWYKIYKSK